jgi:hypothetical protein
MANENDTAIFLPLNFPTYKRNKIDLLKIQLITMKTLERIERIKNLEEMKNENRALLYAIIQEIKKYYNNILKTLPKTNELAKTKIGNTTKFIETKIRENKINFHQNSRIDDELNKIQDKLKSLKI